MLSASIPAKFPIPWANGATAPFVRPIPTASQIGIQAAAASLTDGFPPVTFLPIGAGGTPAFGEDFNGILQQLSKWAQWLGSGMFAQPYDAAYSTAIGGYPANAILQAAASFGFGYLWISLVDNNTTNPDAGGANWQSVSLNGFTTGDTKTSFKDVADPGWVLMNDGSIGDASSNSTTRANADTVNLFTLLYNKVVDAWAPIQTSGGGATTRGAQGTAAAAYAAHCRLVMPLQLGRAIGGSGTGSGLTARALGQNVGEETHQLTIPEMPSHTHTYNPGASNAAQNNLGGAGGGGGGGSGTATIVLNNTGGDGFHNNMQPSTFRNVMIRL